MDELRVNVSHSAADFVFDAFYTGAIGGSAVALFFLLVDVASGQPLFTPSLMGTVLFTGAAADSVTTVQLDMVAAYTIVHFATFGLLGAAISIAIHEVELHAQHPLIVLGTLLVAFEVGFGIAAGLVIPGVIMAIGPIAVAFGNLLAATSIGVFLLATHQPGRWAQVKHALHLA